MRSVRIICFALCALLAPVAASAQELDPDSPEQVVRRQLAFYNEGDLENFLRLHHDDAQYYDLTGELLMDGKAAIRTAFADLFENYPELEASIAYRAVIGNRVVDHEYFKPRGPNGPTQQFVVIYTVEEGLITRVDLVQPDRE